MNSSGRKRIMQRWIRLCQITLGARGKRNCWNSKKNSGDGIYAGRFTGHASSQNSQEQPEIKNCYKQLAMDAEPKHFAFRFLNHFTRITSGGKKFIPQIDGLRFIAIMAVIAYHVRGICLFHFGANDTSQATTDLVSRILDTGHLGVPLFFSISGFILSLPFANERFNQLKPVGLWEYYKRRVTRIEPPYIIHLIFLFLLCALIYRRLPLHQQLYQNTGWFEYVWQHLLASLTYANGFIFGKHPYPNVVLWSLEVEIQFYILAPFLARAFLSATKWKRRIILIHSIFLLSLAHLFVEKNNYFFGFSLLGNLQFFLTGFLLADLYLTNHLATQTRNYKWDLLFLLACGTVVGFHTQPFLPLILPWLIFACCAAAFRGVICSKVLTSLWVTTIGGMCYTIYLYHSLIISAVIRLTIGFKTHILGLDLFIQFLLITIIIVVICSLLFVLFERPFMRRNWPTHLRRLFSKKNDLQLNAEVLGAAKAHDCDPERFK
ncbi:MAG: acyltransferase [Verrucomicrobiota bacterium]